MLSEGKHEWVFELEVQDPHWTSDTEGREDGPELILLVACTIEIEQNSWARQMWVEITSVKDSEGKELEPTLMKDSAWRKVLYEAANHAAEREE